MIHIGMHKAGSSAIQYALDGYDDGESFYADLGDRNHSAPIYTAFCDNPDEYPHLRRHGASSVEIAALLQKTLSSLAAVLSRIDRKQVIFSGEDINRLGSDGVKRLRDFFSTFSVDITAVIYVRDPLSYAVSAFQQSVKAGMASVPKVLPPRYRSIIEPFLLHLGPENVRIINYARTPMCEGGVVADFANVCGLKNPISGAQNANRSLSGSALKLLYLFNRTNPVSIGDPMLMKARALLINKLGELELEREEIKRDVFATMADYADAEWLEEKSGILFTPQERENAGISPEEWLLIPPAGACVALAGALERLGVKGSYNDNIAALVSRLFYYYLRTV